MLFAEHLRHSFLIRHGLLLLITMGSAGQAWAAEGPVYYRYRDDAGKPVLSNLLPADVAQRGYQVVDSFGRVISEVAPALTPEQIAERDRKQAEQSKQAEIIRQQEEADLALLKQFPRREDAIRARDRRIAELDTLIVFKRSAVLRSESKIEEQENQAAVMEKTGRAVPEILKETVSRERAQVEKLKAEISVHEVDKEAVFKEYEQKIERLDFLSGTH